MSLLEIRNVTHTFGSLVAVADVSLTVDEGELRAVIGPNGAGKTTFFNLISGLFPPSQGRSVFDGHDITAMPAHKRVTMGMARTFQITEIFPELSVRENLRIPVEVAEGLRLRPWLSRAADARIRTRVSELLEMGGLESKAERVAGELPHGDQRATEIMMALALNPRLLGQRWIHRSDLGHQIRGLNISANADPAHAGRGRYHCNAMALLGHLYPLISGLDVGGI